MRRPSAVAMTLLGVLGDETIRPRRRSHPVAALARRRGSASRAEPYIAAAVDIATPPRRQIAIRSCCASGPSLGIALRRSVWIARTRIRSAPRWGSSDETTRTASSRDATRAARHHLALLWSRVSTAQGVVGASDFMSTSYRPRPRRRGVAPPGAAAKRDRAEGTRPPAASWRSNAAWFRASRRPGRDRTEPPVSGVGARYAGWYARGSRRRSPGNCGSRGRHGATRTPPSRTARVERDASGISGISGIVPPD